MRCKSILFRINPNKKMKKNLLQDPLQHIENQLFKIIALGEITET